VKILSRHVDDLIKTNKTLCRLAERNHRLQLVRFRDLSFDLVVDAPVVRCRGRLIGRVTKFKEGLVRRDLRRRTKMNEKEDIVR
jgi:hypothetical protein